MSLSAEQLATARATVAAFMPDSAIVFKAPAVTPGTGMTSSTPGATNTYACRVDRALSRRGSESVQHSAVEATARYILVLPWNAVVDSTMQASVSGVTYDIAEVASGGSQAIETRCLVTRSV